MHDSMLIVLERPAPTPLVTDTIMRLLNQLVAKTTEMGEELRHLSEGFQELNVTQQNYDAKLDAVFGTFDAKLDAVFGTFDAKLDALSGTFDAKLGGVDRSLAAQINSLSTSAKNRVPCKRSVLGPPCWFTWSRIEPSAQAPLAG